ncbi:sodium-transporting two-sector ATPase [Candidatus Saccharibacteria bacterium]|nr:sodium-transporting two-sector ATPase [Candidatus Saccharibacteria bacterium]
MFDNSQFQKLVEADNLTGEVVAVNRFIVEVKGLEGVRIGAQILFENGQRGLVREAYGDKVILYNIDTEELPIGVLAVVENDVLSVPVGEGLIGRVVNPMGQPIDGKGAVKATKKSGIFTPAPGIMDRKMLDTQLASGVTAVDSFFPIVLGQRIAILGDSKSGKSTFLSQLSANQDGTDRIVVYVLIGKRKVDVERLLRGLNESGAMEHTIVVLADIFDSLTQSYLAPYAACAMAEELWYNLNRDVIIIYDDLSSHAESYRQLSLLQEVDPGRDSYPGDIFYTHSSLLERAGKLLSNDKTLTSLPVVLTPNDDITAYLSTNVMSITDGQIIFDLGYFRRGIRPAVNAGLSVSRVGGQAQTKRQKQLSTALFKALARYKQADEFSHFSSQLSAETRLDLQRGKHLYQALGQTPEELFSLVEQQLMLETIMIPTDDQLIDVAGLREAVKDTAKRVKTEEEYDAVELELLKKFGAKKVEETVVPELAQDEKKPAEIKK